jgi:Immunoglobulin domain
MNPEKLDLIEGDPASVTCEIHGSEEDIPLRWSVNSIPLNTSVGEVNYKFNSTSDYNGKNISCELRIANFKSILTCPVSVKYPPTFKNGSHDESINLKVPHKKPLELDCSTNGEPKGAVKWYFGRNQKDLKEIADTDEKLTRHQMTSEHEGFYKCLVENSVGYGVKYFNVIEHINALSSTKEASIIIGLAIVSVSTIVLTSSLIHMLLMRRMPSFLLKK